MLKGYHKQGSRLDSCLPITLPILHKLLDSASKLAICRYQACQFKAMCSTPYYPILRVGEMTSTSTAGPPTPLQIDQLIKLADNSGNTVAPELVFAKFKHSSISAFSIVIQRQSPFCPVQLLFDYLALRGSQPGHLFAKMENSPVSRSFFADMRRLALTSCGLALQGSQLPYWGCLFCFR